MKVHITQGTEVTIRVDGVLTREHRDHEDKRSSEAVAVSYIEVTSGSAFSVHITTNDHRLRNHDDAVRYVISLDGKKVNARTLKHFDPHGNAHGQSIGRETVIDGQKMLSKYTFGDLKTSDEESQALSIEDVKYLGEIEVATYVVRMVSSGRARPPPTFPSSALETWNMGTRSEKDLKGRSISHMAMLGEPEVLQHRREHPFARSRYEERFSTTYPYGKEPFATFVFKYRSRSDLQIEGIIPRDLSPVPPPNVKPESEVIAKRWNTTRNDELTVPEQHIDMIQRRKRHRSEAFGSDQDEVLYASPIQRSSRNRRRSPPGQSLGYIIDLTGDD